MSKLLHPALLAVLALGGCSGGDYGDLDTYMAEMRARPQGAIEPIPTFKPYKAFTYAAQTARPPFDPMPEVQPDTPEDDGEDIAPNLQRSKEFLESFSIESLSMVGTLEQRSQRWALMTDAQGGVHRVQVGNFIGLDHGRIEEITDSWVRVTEITSNGVGGWARRPRVIEITGQN